MPRLDDRLEIPAPIVGVQLGWRSWVLIIASTLFGLFALFWPLIIPAWDISHEHAADAPFIFAAMLPMIMLLVVAQINDGGMDSKALAMLGVLSAINAVIRPALGAGTAGIESVFFLLILAGRVFGPGFGFMLGYTSLFASALLTAGVGAWLPFQMMCAGWIGLAAGLLPKKVGPKTEMAMLVGLGIVSAYVFGALMNMWFWPSITGISIPGVGAGALDYVPGAPFAENMRAFLWFTLLTSTGGWDTGRAITTSIALLILGRPLLVVLRRAAGMSRISTTVPVAA